MTLRLEARRRRVRKPDAPYQPASWGFKEAVRKRLQPADPVVF
ncbi:hypothetical protein HVPorG_04917 [Roseomonas mucosa]|nr:hypothetical protein HVPorG_04917 [Roseomonas mucosa]